MNNDITKTNEIKTTNHEQEIIKNYAPFGGYVDVSDTIQKQYLIDQQLFHGFNRRKIIDITHIMASRIFPMLLDHGRSDFWDNPFKALNDFDLGYRYVTMPVIRSINALNREEKFLYRSIFVEHCLPSNSSNLYTCQRYPTHTYLVKKDFSVLGIDDIATLSSVKSDNAEKYILHFYSHGTVDDYIVIASRDNSVRQGPYENFIMIYKIVDLERCVSDLNLPSHKCVIDDYVQCLLVGVFAQRRHDIFPDISTDCTSNLLPNKEKDHIHNHLVPYLRSTLAKVDKQTLTCNVYGIGMEIWPVKYNAEIDWWTRRTYECIRILANLHKDESIKVLDSEMEMRSLYGKIETFIMNVVKVEFYQAHRDENLSMRLNELELHSNSDTGISQHILNTKVTISVEAEYVDDSLMVTFSFPSIVAMAIMKKTFEFELFHMEEVYAEVFFMGIYNKKPHAESMYDLYTIKLKPGERVEHYVSILLT